MAEAIINHELRGRVRALSAGTRPERQVAAEAIEALHLGGYSSAGLHPKGIDAVLSEAIDLVITVCDSANETCPVFPRPVTRMHLPFHDPKGEPLASFIQVRDEIRDRLLPVICAALGVS
jgi:arsenate reductase